MDGFRTHKLLCPSVLNRSQCFIFTNFLLATCVSINITKQIGNCVVNSEFSLSAKQAPWNVPR